MINNQKNYDTIIKEEMGIPTMLTIRETARKTNIAEYYIRNLVRENKIHYVKTGKKYLINLEKFIDFLNTPQSA